MKKMVVALGGNALIQGGKDSIKDQLKTVQEAIKNILPFHKEFDIVITHGNGPQVGNIMIRDEYSKGKAYHIPLDVAVAQSQGEIGYLIETAIFNANRNVHVIPVLTQVLVDAKDPGFMNPTKPVGPFFSTSAPLKGKPYKKIPKKGYRRVVASPKPIHIFESEGIKKLVEHHKIVIACGGGGIPVIRKNRKIYGIEAVIDKDLASSLLATLIKAHTLLILTDVPNVAINYNTKDETSVPKMTIKQAQEYIKQNQFSPGAMLPKIEAAINFIKKGGKRVIITSPEMIKKALKGKNGTTITKEV